MALVIPNTISPGTTADATAVEENFQEIETYVNAQLTTLAQNEAAYAKGRKTHTSLTANSATFTTLADIAGFTVTFTGETGRWYRLILHAHISSSVAGDWGRLAIATNAGTILADSKHEMPVLNEEQSVDTFAIVQPGAGSVTYKVQGERLSGTGNVMMEASATSPATLLVEDMGD